MRLSSIVKTSSKLLENNCFLFMLDGVKCYYIPNIQLFHSLTLFYLEGYCENV